MAEEAKKTNTIDVLKRRLDEAIATGNIPLTEELSDKIEYLESLDDSTDVDRLAKNSHDLRKYLTDVTQGGDLEEDAKVAMDVEMPKRPERDEKTARKTISLEELGKIAQNTDGVSDVFDPESDYYWQKWTNEQLKEYAKKAGMSRGEFLGKVAEIETLQNREAIANEGLGGALMSIFTPRRQKDIAEGNDPSWASTVLDVSENVAQAVPFGRVFGTAAKAVKFVPAPVKKFVANVAENAVVPSFYAYIDAARDGDISEGAAQAVKGTAVNFATPKNLRRAKNLVFSGNKTAGNVAEAAVETANKEGKLFKYLEPELVKESLTSYGTNKAGKDKYGERYLNILVGMDPTGLSEGTLSNLPGSETDKKNKNTEKQKKLEKQHQDDLVKEYQRKFGLMKYLED